MSLSVHVNFGIKGWTISVHDDFGTYEINFGTRDFCSTVSVHRCVQNVMFMNVIFTQMRPIHYALTCFRVIKLKL